MMLLLFLHRFVLFVAGFRMIYLVYRIPVQTRKLILGMKECYTAQWLAIVFLYWFDNYVRKYTDTFYHERTDQSERSKVGVVMYHVSYISTREYKFVIRLFVLLLTKLTPVDFTVL